MIKTLSLKNFKFKKTYRRSREALKNMIKKYMADNYINQLYLKNRVLLNTLGFKIHKKFYCQRLELEI